MAVLLSFLQPEMLQHWDEFQLAYGVDDFDLRRHQPHPPGYYLVVQFARLLKHFTGDAVAALRWTSLVSVGVWAGVVVAWLPARLQRGPRAMLALAVLTFCVVSPLVRLYGTVGLSYAPEAMILTLLCLGIAQRPTGARVLLLGIAIGLAGGCRQSLTVWGVLLVYVQARGWLRWRDIGWLGGGLVFGTICWIVPLVWGSGGWAQYQAASSPTVLSNILGKSLLFTGMTGLARRAAMLNALWLGLGPLLPMLVAMAAWRYARSHRSTALDSLWRGGWIAVLFYFLTIYDSEGYMLAPVAAWAAYLWIGTGHILLTMTTARRWLYSGALWVGTLAFLVSPYMGAAYRRYEQHDARLSRLFLAVRQRFSPQDTVLVAPTEHLSCGFRHMAYYLPEYPTLQLAKDPLFAIVSPERPFLFSHSRRLSALGPQPLDLATLTSGRLQHVVYMVPTWQVSPREHVDPSCKSFWEQVDVPGLRPLGALSVARGGKVEANEQRLHCR